MINVEVFAAPGLTLSASLFAVNSDVVVAEANSVAEMANTKGAYLAEFDPVTAGAYLVVAYDDASPPEAVAAAYVYPEASSGTYRTGNYADVVVARALEQLRKIALNKTVTDPVAGTLTVYADDDVTPALEADLFEDVGETQPYRGRGAEVRGRMSEP